MNGKNKDPLKITGTIAAVILLSVAAIYFTAIVFNSQSDNGGTTSTPSAAAVENNTEMTTADLESPEEKAEKEFCQRVDELLANMTLEEKINQLFFITPEALTGSDNVTEAGEMTKNALCAHPVGGIIYFTKNTVSEEQTKQMIANTKQFAEEVCPVPLFIGIDEEGGTVARLASSENITVPYVGNMSAVGESRDMQKAYEAGDTLGKYLSDYGFNLDFAPVADVLTNTENQVVRYRSFGSDPYLVSEMAHRVSEGLNDNGVLSCYKHFPGHGATEGDTHEGFAYTDKTYDELLQCELLPFIDAIDNHADFIMVGHFSLPNITGDNTPASISDKIINDILIDKLKFNGIIITDSLSMQALTDLYAPDTAAVTAVKAGADMLLMPQDFNAAYNGVLNAVNSGEISVERIDRSVKKIIGVKLRYAEREP